jgi:hypothetical protein
LKQILKGNGISLKLLEAVSQKVGLGALFLHDMEVPMYEKTSKLLLIFLGR